MRFHLPLSLAFGALFCGSAVAESFDARDMARGGAGLTLGEFHQSLSNPAMVNQRRPEQNFSLGINVGVIASDKDGLLEDVEDTQDDLDDLEECQYSGGCPDSDSLADKMATMDGKQLRLDAGGGLLIGIPNNTLPLALVGQTRARIGAGFRYDNNDREELREADGTNHNTNDSNTEFRQEDLQSEITASGIEIREFGIMGGRILDLGNITDIQAGATLKYQQITLVDNTQTIGDYETDEVLDEDRSMKEHSALNLDLGMRKTLGETQQYSVAATVENLLPKSFSGPDGDDYDMAPVLAVAGGYHAGFVKAEAGLELSPRKGFALLEDTQFAHLGAELSAGRHAQLRFGYRVDMKSNVPNLTTVGIGLTPFDVMNLDISAMTGEGDTLGAAVNLGMRF